MAKEPKLTKLISRIDERVKQLGLSERRVSMDATGKPDAIRYIKTRQHMPSAFRLALIARALETTPGYLLGEIEQPGPPLSLNEETDWVIDASKNLPKTQNQFEDMIPIYPTVGGVRIIKDDGSHLSHAYVVDRMEEINLIKYPPMLRHRSDLYGIYVPSRSGRNELLLVEPKEPSTGETAILYLNEAGGVLVEGGFDFDSGEPVIVAPMGLTAPRSAAA